MVPHGHTLKGHGALAQHLLQCRLSQPLRGKTGGLFLKGHEMSSVSSCQGQKWVQDRFITRIDTAFKSFGFRGLCGS